MPPAVPSPTPQMRIRHLRRHSGREPTGQLRTERPHLGVNDSVISRCQCTGQVGVREGCAQPLELMMILAVWWLGVRRLNGRLPAVGHVPGAGVDGHGNLLAGGHGVGTMASVTK